MNKDSEQLTFNKQVVLDQDEPKYSSKQLREITIRWIGKVFCTDETVLDKKVLVYNNSGRKTIVLLKNISLFRQSASGFQKKDTIAGLVSGFLCQIEKRKSGL